MAVSDYSMFDVQKEKEEQRHKTAYEAAQIPLGRVPVYASSVGGDLYNEGLMGLAGMLGGTPDPATAKQQAILKIQERFPNPDTFEEFMELANALRMGGFYSFAEQAITAANNLRNSMPKSTYTTVKVGDTDKKGNRITRTILYKDGVPFKELGSQATDAPTSETYGYKEIKTEDLTTGVDKIETYLTGSDGKIIGEPEYTRTVDKASSTITDPTKIAQTNMLNSHINEASTSLRLLPEWSNATEEQIMAEARTIGSEKFLEESPAAGDTSINVDDFLFYDAKRQAGNTQFVEAIGKTYAEMTDDDIRKLVRLQKPTSPENVIKTELFKTNLANVNELQKEMNLKVDQAYSDQMIHKKMLEAFAIGADTGFGAEFQLAVNQFGVSFLGLDPSKEMVATEVLRSQMKQMTLDRMEKLKGTPSDKDLDLVADAGANMDKSPQANMIIIGFELFLEQELMNRQKFMLNWVDNYTKDHPNEYPSAAQYMTVEDAFRNRNDESRWSPLAGTEADRQLAISIWGTNEFTKGREMLANLDIGSDVVQTEISESKILSNKADAAKDVMKQLGY